MLFWKKSNLTKYEQQMSDAAEQLQTGDVGGLRITYEAMASGRKELVKKAGRAIATYMEPLKVKQIIRLSELFRDYTSMTWGINWKNVDVKSKKNWFAAEEDYKAVLMLGTFHPSGYYREYCMEQLASYQNVLIYFLLRTNDWVKEVREKAYSLAVNRIQWCSVMELVSAVQAMEKLRYSGRISREYFESLDQLFYDRLETGLKEVPLYQIHKYEFDTRKYLYRLLVSKRTLNLEQINILLEWEKHSFCKQILITNILQYYECSDEQITQYLTNKNYVVRRRAMEYKYNREKNAWLGVEQMLLDSNKGVRELAVFIVNRHTQINILEYYIKHLEDENPLQAIVGIGEHGGKKEAERLLPYLHSNEKKQIRATLEALGKLIGIDGYDLFWEYLMNAENGISKSAYSAIKSAGISYEAKMLYDLCTQTNYEHVRRYTLQMLLRKNSWIRLPYLLKLYKEPAFETLQREISFGIATRSMYGCISEEQADEIKQILQQGSFSEGFVKNLLFDLKFVVKK